MKYAIIVPALERNSYHDRGDLASFGDVTLLEWKLSQFKSMKTPHQVYVTTPSQKISELAERKGATIISRSLDQSLQKTVMTSIASVHEDTVLWANVTSPFLSSSDYDCLISTFEKKNKVNDSLIAVQSIKEYLYYNGTPLHFAPREYTSRLNLSPVYKVTNGAYCIKKETALKIGHYFGNNSYFYEVDWLSAIEIKDVENYTIAKDLVETYFKTKEI